MKKKEKKESNKEELLKKLGEMEEKMRLMKWKAEGAKSKNVKEEKNLRREIARTLTELNKNHE